MRFIAFAFAALLGFLIGALIGWVMAHEEVATECQRQGTFYVGKQNFECKLKTKTVTEQPSA